MYPSNHVQGLDSRGLDIRLPAPGDPLIAVKFTAVGKPHHSRLITPILTMRTAVHMRDLRFVHRHSPRSRRSKPDNGLCTCLRLPFCQQAVPANRSENLVARAAQILQHSIRPCVFSPTHDVDPWYHHPRSKSTSPSLPSPRAN